MLKTIRFILSPLLLIISLIYGIITHIRNFLFDKNFLKSTEFSIPIISVGNITVGGTGKTPHIEYLINLLKDEFKIVTLSRGYKRKTKGFVLADNKSTAQDIGDEPRQIKQKYKNSIEVIVDEDRTRAINKIIINKPQTDAILMDDAFQHRKVKPNISILLIDYSRPLKKDFLLPLGNLREFSCGKSRANIIIITKCPQNISETDKQRIRQEISPNSNQQLFFTSFSYGNYIPVFSDISTDTNLIEKSSNNTSILLITGIANPKPLINHVKENISSDITLLQFPDHHDFNNKDIEKIEKAFKKINSENKTILTTEKDAMRLQNFSNIAQVLKQNSYYLPIEIFFIGDNKQNFNNKIIYYVRKN